jgi:hypothetical protein
MDSVKGVVATLLLSSKALAKEDFFKNKFFSINATRSFLMHSSPKIISSGFLVKKALDPHLYFDYQITLP